MPPSINMLTNVQTAEVSLVRRGANNKRFAITKEDPNMKLADLIKKVLETEAEGEADLVTTLKAAGADEETTEVAVANFRLQAGFSDKLSHEEFATVAKAAGFDIAKEKKEEDEEDPKKPGFFRSGKKMPTAKSHAPADMPEEVRKAFEDQNDELETIRKEAADNKAELVALQKESQRKEYIEKCSKNYSHVPGQSVEEMGTMLQKAYEVGDSFGKQLEKQWENTQEALKKSALLQTQGAAHSTHDGASAMGQMETIAKELKVKDPALSHSQALSKAMDSSPELYEQYLAENPAQTGKR